jgi:hypothetical protein
MQENLKNTSYPPILYENSLLSLPISLIFFQYQNFEASLSTQYPLRRLVLILASEYFQSSLPLFQERLVVQLDSERSARKTEHWQRIAQSACEQCGRNSVPVIDEPADLPIVLGVVSGASRLVLIPGSRESLTHLPRGNQAITLLIGPEGGLSEPESRLALEHDFLPRSLGPRVLRTETAAIAAIAILQSHFGDLANGAETPPG